MKECDNSKIHISRNFILSICLLIILDTLLLKDQHYTATIRYTSPNYTSLHFATDADDYDTFSCGNNFQRCLEDKHSYFL